MVRLLSPGAVLSFHAATSPDLPSNSVVNIPATQIISLIETASTLARIVPLNEILERRKAGRSLRGMVAITFDDAYASLDLIRAHLEKQSVPVTLFVATSYSQTGQSFWWDRVDDLYPDVPAGRWAEFERATGLPDSYRSAASLQLGALRPLRQWLLRGHLGRTSHRVEEALAQLEAETSRKTAQRPMVMEEIESFCRRTGASVATHTQTHPVLPLLSPEDIRTEVVDCFHQLIERFGRSAVPALAAPFGLYDANVVSIAAAAGITTFSLGNTTLSSRFREGALPRLSMTVGVTPLRLLALLSGAWERVAGWIGRSPSAGYPALPGPTT